MRALYAVTVLIEAPFAVAMTELARRMALPLPWLWGVGLAGLSVVLFAKRVRPASTDRKKASSLGQRFIDIPYYIHWCACLFTIVPAALSTLVAAVIELVRGEALVLPRGFFLWTYAAGLLVCGYGILVRRRWFYVTELEVPVAGLDSRLDGLRIAHLSDLHIGTHTPKSWGHRWTRAANGRAPDITVVTGDMVSSGTEFHKDIADVVGTLRAKGGVYVTMGNHDYFGEGEPLVSLLREQGVVVLRNEGRVIEHNQQPLYIAGIDDTWTKRDDLESALRERPEGALTVLLSHDPDRFRQASKRGVHLTLAGHTHGGQIAFPFLSRWLSLSHLTHNFHEGMYRKGDATMYVHPGLGTTGPPMRLGVAPRVVILTLRVE